MESAEPIVIRNKTLTIQEGGIRLDAALLRAFPSSTRAFVREAVERGDVLVASCGEAPRRAGKGLKLAPGASIVVRELYEACDNLVSPGGACPPPVFEDADLLAFDKPAGQPVQPLSCRETGTLMNDVVGRYPECRAIREYDRDGRAANTLMAGALHRIDADTSGLVLVARNQPTFDALRAQFADQSVRKTYLALVEGSVAGGGTLENDLVHDPTLPFCRMIDAHHNRLTRAQCERLRPLHAVTSFAPLAYTAEGNEERTLLEVTIFTGVTHQIRAQLALAGMHIVNDRLYGAFAVENQTGHCLHALATAFAHPKTNGPVEIRTQLPGWALFLSRGRMLKLGPRCGRADASDS